jgi:hypothetical protein
MKLKLEKKDILLLYAYCLQLDRSIHRSYHGTLEDFTAFFQEESFALDMVTKYFQKKYLISPKEIENYVLKDNSILHLTFKKFFKSLPKKFFLLLFKYIYIDKNVILKTIKSISSVNDILKGVLEDSDITKFKICLINAHTELEYYLTKNEINKLRDINCYMLSEFVKAKSIKFYFEVEVDNFQNITSIKVKNI